MASTTLELRRKLVTFREEEVNLLLRIFPRATAMNSIHKIFASPAIPRSDAVRIIQSSFRDLEIKRT